jgi:hypothetical protein
MLVTQLEILYPKEKIRPGMTVQTKHVIGIHKIQRVEEDGRFRTEAGYLLYYEFIEFCLVSLAEAIELEDDPIKKLALMILAEDPQAVDLARDVLRC